MNAFRPNADLDAFKRGAFGVSGGFSDPLAGLVFALRLQTHNGDGVPLGLFQDAAGTTPATADGDPVGRWEDVLSGSGLAATQSTSGQRPILRFSGGLPYLEFDGSDDNMAVSGFTAAAASTVAARTRITKQTFCKPWNHAGTQAVQAYVNDSGLMIMASGMNGPSWTADPADSNTHQCKYAGASSDWYLNGSLLSTGNPGTDVPSGNFLISDIMGPVPATTMNMSCILVAAGDLANQALVHSYLSTLQP